MDKAFRKKRKFKYSGNESKRVDLDQKRELQKCNDTIMLLVVIEKAFNGTLLVIVACGENKNVHKIHPLK